MANFYLAYYFTSDNNISANFAEAREITNKNEGGYANTTGDRGGETYRGISRAYWPNWEGWPIIDNIKASGRLPNASEGEPLDTMVMNFYKNNFWDKLRGNDINSQTVANFLYDWYVTSQSAAISLLRQSIDWRKQQSVLEL